MEKMFLFDAFPKDEKDKTCTAESAENPEKKELKFSLKNSIISAIYMDFVLDRFSTEDCKERRMKF